MMVRFRWYRVRLPIEWEALSSLISEHSFSQDGEKGFLLFEVNHDSLSFRFFWRSNLYTTALDEDGNPVYEKVSTLNIQDATLIKTERHIILRLENPGRSSKELFNSLEEIFGMGFSLKQLIFNSTHMDSILSSIDVSRLTRVKLTGSVESDEIVARIDLASKKGIRTEELNFLESIKHKTESASYDLMVQGVKGSLSYSSSGLVKISGQLSPLITSLIEDKLIEPREYNQL